MEGFSWLEGGGGYYVGWAEKGGGGRTRFGIAR